MPKGGAGQRGPSGRRLAVLVLGLLALNYLIAAAFLPGPAERSEIPYAPTFLEQVREGNVERINTEGEQVEGRLKEAIPAPQDGGGGDEDEPASFERFATQIPTFADEAELAGLLRDNDVIINAEPPPGEEGTGFLVTLLIAFGPVVLLVALFVFFMRRAQSGMGGAGGLSQLGKSRARKVEGEKQRVHFDEVAGIDEAKAELEELVDFLRNPGRYRSLGGRIPRGVLLTGPPGTGKTLLARATAGEADVPFFSISASEFVEAVVGVGAARVRDMFKDARESAPAVIFVDELDAVGRRRSSGQGISGGNDEREQTLNQILTEMDGFESDDTVVVLGATNRPDDLDEALLRPGRFDRRIAVQPPDRHGRREILGVHTQSLPLADDVDLDRLAASTPGMVGADLANLANEAALGAARRRADQVALEDFSAALDRLALGSPRGITLTEEDRRLTAYHEAGHALIAMLTSGADPVRKVSIMPRGESLGQTLSTPDDDRVSMRRGELRARMLVTLGGRVAEELVCDDVSTGAENDLEQIAELARRMAGRWGMSETIGPIAVLPRPGSDGPFGGQQVSEEARREVEREASRIARELHEEARELLGDHREQLDALADALLEEETLDGPAAYRAAGLESPPVVAGAPQ